MSSATLELNATRPRRPNGTFSKVVPEDMDVRNDILSFYHNGGSISTTANQFMITPAAIRDFLADENVLRKRGQSVNGRTISPRKRTTVDVTPEIVQQALSIYREVGGVVQAAKRFNVNPMELSNALKASGEVIQRGRRKVA